MTSVSSSPGTGTEPGGSGGSGGSGGHPEERLSTQPAEPRPPGLGPVELFRWAWRQLTSMRIALILLFLLALAAVPGSLVPQRPVDPLAVSRFAREHPGLAPLYEKLSLFEVFTSPWFSAIYLLLFISLVGCVVPRSRQHARAIRARPPAAPRNLSRLPAWRSWETGAAPEAVLAAARTVLGSRRFRLEPGLGGGVSKWLPGSRLPASRLATLSSVAAQNPVRLPPPPCQPGADEPLPDLAPTLKHPPAAVSAEKGYLRETGNLVFHVALIGVLVAVALGSLYGYQGNVLVVEGRGFANTRSQYDDFTPGRRFDPAGLRPFSFRLAEFSAEYEERGSQRGAARSFDAAVDYRTNPDGPQRRAHIKVNEPLRVGGAKVYLVGHGYAPVFTVRDGKGQEVYSGPTPFLPQDQNFASAGVIKAPDARPQQLGFSGFFLPTAARDHVEGIVSVFPAPANPAVILLAWKGDLGLDDGSAESVYQLDTDKLQRVVERGRPVTKLLQDGETLTLPDGLGSVRYEGYREWATFQIARKPAKGLALGSAVVALAGLTLSLFVRRRRVWVRVTPAAGGRAVVEVAGLARTESASMESEIDEIAERLRQDAPAVEPDGPDEPHEHEAEARRSADPGTDVMERE